MKSVQRIKEENKCCGCGICAAICPIKVIDIRVSENGKCEPCIDSACVSCGKCLTVCPKSESVMVTTDVAKMTNVSCKLVKSKDSSILRNATSGGFVTTLVKELLQREKYEGAFLVDGEDYGRWLQTKYIAAGDDLSRTQKSRYVQIGHKDEIEYILNHRDEKLILVGTPCYFHGFLKVVEACKLNRDNYLLVGLFCDKTMTTHVWEYFDQIFADGKLKALHFRSKKERGWPGDVRLFLGDGSEQHLPRAERMAVKEYFMPEACLDCMDKLNEYADFSVGDDYVSGKTGEDGCNSLIIRTDKAFAEWEEVGTLFECQECSYEAIAKSQNFYDRAQDLQKNRQQRLDKLMMGADRQYAEIRANVLAHRKKKAGLLNRLVSKCRRILNG